MLPGPVPGALSALGVPVSAHDGETVIGDAIPAIPAIGDVPPVAGGRPALPESIPALPVSAPAAPPVGAPGVLAQEPRGKSSWQPSNATPASVTRHHRLALRRRTARPSSVSGGRAVPNHRPHALRIRT